jgi:toxin CcdB
MQCAVHANPDDEAGHIPYLIDVQADLLADLDTRIVVPLIRSTVFGRPATRLHPVFTIADQQVVMATHLLAAVRRGALGASVASLLDQRDVIISAIDVLWSGV